MFDPELYRDKAEVERWKQRDPIAAFVAAMQQVGALRADDLAAVEADAAAEIAAARAFAEAAPFEPVEDLARDVVTPRGAS
jgi:pyruvate dehydrogenase E1 component alpha subunit